MKVCRKCGVKKPNSGFYMRDRKKKILHSYCKDCQRLLVQKNARKRATSEYYVRNKEAIAVKMAMKTYSLTEEQVIELRGKTVCDSCGRVGKTHIDHDHVTGQVRGVLCPMCNKAIGSLGDTVEGVQQALDYLKRAYNA